ncbi:hypothetical protein K0U07_05990, partial [bacterium]|nr:hypothetical protein [bacterium]
GSFFKLIEMIQYGNLRFFGELFIPSVESIVACALFYLFVRFIAPKISLPLGSVLLLSTSYFFLPITFFYDNLGTFLLALALLPTKKRTSETLFFSLFFLTLLHTFSCLLISFFYYGHNGALYLNALLATVALILLMSKKMYPSQTTMLSLFPILLFPSSYLAHHTLPLSPESIFMSLATLLTIYTLLQKKKESLTIFSLTLWILSIFSMDKLVIFPFAFAGIALCLHLSLLVYANSHRRLLRSHV